MKLQTFRAEITQHNKDHPELKGCIYSNCPNKIDPAPDNQVLCEEHNLVMLHWFYELDGWKYGPESYDAFTGKKLPRRLGSDLTMVDYRKRYCNWIASLSPIEYLAILKNAIGDDA